jgi:hypothetical protein
MYKIIGADGNEYGPIAAAQVRQWIAEGRLNGLSKIQVDGSGVWMQLRDMPEFSTLVPASPPPISLGAPRPPSFPSAPRPPSPSGLPPNNPLAAWSLGTGIASLPCCFSFILSPVSIVLGAVALSQINRNPNQGGRGMAAAGIVLGSISLVMAVVAWLIFLLHADVTQFQNGFPFR